ncbi:uncharacterized protein M421DRAFT_422695 [Didymella exigua CBS 183.55]|uniref:Uncharacterized protein n=1 Tax=Didymella exigua CBS 183.55 TaxID=1150837 RepID=A0A6A5RFU5_9PLEO|nr:uncharacterized protein M421DRAFT_422695 [Didymella exigua CBS 183.55]KAF1926353.1 hypothetical protein M421DRAFT_422695 [Didymella exigua CBS 183.55]
MHALVQPRRASLFETLCSGASDAWRVYRMMLDFVNSPSRTRVRLPVLSKSCLSRLSLLPTRVSHYFQLVSLTTSNSCLSLLPTHVYWYFPTRLSLLPTHVSHYFQLTSHYFQLMSLTTSNSCLSLLPTHVSTGTPSTGIPHWKCTSCNPTPTPSSPLRGRDNSDTFLEF